MSAPWEWPMVARHHPLGGPDRRDWASVVASWLLVLVQVAVVVGLSRAGDRVFACFVLIYISVMAAAITSTVLGERAAARDRRSS